MEDDARNLIILMEARLEKNTFRDVLCVLHTIRQRNVHESRLMKEALKIEALLMEDLEVWVAYASYWDRYFPYVRTISSFLAE